MARDAFRRRRADSADGSGSRSAARTDWERRPECRAARSAASAGSRAASACRDAPDGRRTSPTSRGLGLLARIHHGHAVADLPGGAEIVGGEQHRGAALGDQVAQQLEDLRLDRHVERRGRLVGDDQLRLGQQRHRDHDALALPAGELVRILRACRRSGSGKLHGAQHRDRALAVAPPARARIAALAGLAIGRLPAHQLGDLVAGGEQRTERAVRILRDERDGAAADARCRPRPAAAPADPRRRRRSARRRSPHWPAARREWRAPAWSCRSPIRRPGP